MLVQRVVIIPNLPVLAYCERSEAGLTIAVRAGLQPRTQAAAVAMAVAATQGEPDTAADPRR
jgi:hypothetical protein